MTVCPTCFNEDHRDKGHRLRRHKEAVVQKKAAIQETLKDVEPRVEKINQYRKKLESVCDQIAKDAATEHSEIDETIKIQIDFLKRKGESMKKQIGEMANAEREKITKSIDELKKIVDDFEDIKMKARELSRHGDDEDVEKEADDLLAQLNNDWSPSVPVEVLQTQWQSKRADLNKLDYETCNVELGTCVDETHSIRFQFDILPYSGAKVTATETGSFSSGFEEWGRTQFCVSDDGHVFMSGKVGNLWNICQFGLDGKKLWETEKEDINNRDICKPCGLQVITLLGKKFLASSSASQHNVLLYDINSPTSEKTDVFKDQSLHPNQMSILPPSTLLVLCALPRGKRKIVYLRQENLEDLQMQSTHVMETNMESAYGIQAVSTDLTPEGTLIVVTSHMQGTITAFKLDGTVAWKAQGNVGGVACNPHGVCADRRGHVYIADGRSRRVLVLNAKNGNCIQTLLNNDQHGIGTAYSVGWAETRDQRFLVVNHKSGRHHHVTTFRIGYQQQVAHIRDQNGGDI